MALVEDYRRNLVRDFHQHARFLLSERERQALYKILKDYHRRRQIDRLVQGLKSVLKTPEKLQLLSYIRNLIPQVHWNEFDKLINYQLRVRRQRSKKQKAIGNSVATHYAFYSTRKGTETSLKFIDFKDELVFKQCED